MALQEGDVVGSWRIVGVLGRGGFADVFRAEHKRIGKPAALKVLRTDGKRPVTEKQKQALKEKQAAAARLLSIKSHDHLVEAYDADMDGAGGFWMAMELLSGRDLRRVLNEEGALSESRALRFLEDLAGALAVVHNHEVIHRDLKPENIFVTDQDEVVIIDFGTARFRDGGTFEGTVGSIPYMSPEHLREDRANPTDERTDVWALGFLMYEMLHGRHPFRDDDGSTAWPPTNELIALVVGMDGLKSTRIRKEVAEVMGRATRRNREERYASMSDFAAALQRLRAPTRQAVVPTERLAEHDVVTAHGAVATVPLEPAPTHGSTASVVMPLVSEQRNVATLSTGGVVAALVALFVLLTLTVGLLLNTGESTPASAAQPSATADATATATTSRQTEPSATAERPRPLLATSEVAEVPTATAQPSTTTQSAPVPVRRWPPPPQSKKKGGLDW